MKKILKTFLIAISSLLGVTSLSACDFFKKSEDVSNQIVIDAASFEYTYTTISFDFKKDANAIYYNVFFTGQENYTMQKVEPNSTYQVPEISDGKYKLFLKAIASVNYTDSNLFYLGEMNKEKPEKSVENLEITANINEKYGIDITTSCVSAKNEQLKFEISGDNVRTFELEAKVNTTVRTEDNLPAGNYSISAWFVETSDYKASQKISYNGALSIGKRKLLLEDFSAIYNRGNISLHWDQDETIDAERKLEITYNNITNKYSNLYKGSSITSGLIINASDYGEGEISFSLQLVSKDSSTYFNSDTIQASTTINKYTVSSAPNLEVEFNQITGNLTVDSPHYSTGKYQLTIYCQSGSREDREPEYFSYNQEVTSFPVIFEKANENWGRGTYSFSLKKKGETALEIDSDISKKTVSVAPLTVTPAVRFSYFQDEEGVYTKISVTPTIPVWVNQSWALKGFTYVLRLSAFLSQNLTTKYLDSEGDTFEFILPNSLPKSLYCVYVTILNKDVGYGYYFSEIMSEVVEAGSNTTDPSSDRLIKNFQARIMTTGAAAMGTQKFRFSFSGFYPYLKLTLIANCAGINLADYRRSLGVSETYETSQLITEILNIPLGANNVHGTFIFEFALKAEFFGLTQTLHNTVEVEI